MRQTKRWPNHALMKLDHKHHKGQLKTKCLKLWRTTKNEPMMWMSLAKEGKMQKGKPH
jgi:hypothetical protein